MSPFAGDIGAGPGSLKWIGQIRREAYRRAWRGDFKKKLALNVKDQEAEELFLVSPQNMNS